MKKKDFFLSLKEELKGKFLKLKSQMHNPQVNGSFQNYITNFFENSPAHIYFDPDRIRLEIKDPPLPDQDFTNRSPYYASQLQAASQQMAFFTEHVLEKLPFMLANEVIPTLKYPPRRNSDIIIKIEKSQTFFLLRFFIECSRTDLSYTEVNHYSLPHKKINKVLYKTLINNALSLDSHSKSEDKGNLDDKACADLILNHTPANILNTCPEQIFNSKIIIKVFDFEKGALFLLLGPSILNINCYQTSGTKLSLTEEFNLYFISDSCSWSLEYSSLDSARPATKQFKADLPHVLILQYSLINLSSWKDKLFALVIGLSVTCGFFIVLLIVISTLIMYYKYKYKPRVVKSNQGIIEMTISTPQNDLKNTFISGERIDNTSLTLELTPERELDHEITSSSNLQDINKPFFSSSQPARNVKPASH